MNTIIQKRKLGESGLEVSALGYGCMPGTSKLNGLEENLGGAEVELSAKEINEIDIAFSSITVRGERYPAHLKARTGK